MEEEVEVKVDVEVRNALILNFAGNIKHQGGEGGGE